MPRVQRQKAAKRHAPAVTVPSKRSFAVPDAQVEELIAPGPISMEPLSDPVGQNETVPSSSRLSRRDKLPSSALVPPEQPFHPYSRSHTRREKRKAKQQLAGGELHTMSAALSEAIGEPLQSVESTNNKADMSQKAETRRKKREEDAKIGQGKGRTLSETARRKQIALESKRIPAIMSHPSFKQSPWATIRLHASNSIAVKDGTPATKTKRG